MAEQHAAGPGEGVVTIGTARLRVSQVGVCGLALVIIALLGCALGPAPLSPVRIVATLLDRLPGVQLSTTLSPAQSAILFQIRLPRVALGILVGALLAGCGATYQGVFRNPLADPYLLGAASGAGLGAVVAITSGMGTSGVDGYARLGVPLCAFVGALLAVGVTYTLGGTGIRGGTTSLILAGVAVSAFTSAIQTFLIQRNPEQLREVYGWLLGRLATSGWTAVGMVLPYAVLSLGFMVLQRRVLDLLSLGDDEAQMLGLRPDRIRLLLVLAASLGTAAAVSASGLIGFVGLVVPHLVRLIFGASHRVIIPLSILCGAALLTGTDIVARLALAPAEIPIGVVTAFLGAPFFLLLLRRARP